ESIDTKPPIPRQQVLRDLSECRQSPCFKVTLKLTNRQGPWCRLESRHDKVGAAGTDTNGT
ncbi:MAG: hypothetical protein WCK17_00570, partial [Verrucomicrobiota bacterium]